MKINFNLSITLSLIICTGTFISCFSDGAEAEDHVYVQEEFQVEKENRLKQFFEQGSSSIPELGKLVSKNFEVLDKVLPRNNKYEYWTEDTLISPLADSALDFIRNANLYGLQPEWYHHSELKMIREKIDSSSDRFNPDLWVKFEILLSDAMLDFTKDIRTGRWETDSLSRKKDEEPQVIASEFSHFLDDVDSASSLRKVIAKLEPTHKGYRQIKELLALQWPTMNKKMFTVLVYPWQKMSTFNDQLRKRLAEGGFLDDKITAPDSLTLAKAIEKAQVSYGLTVDGKPGRNLASALNNWDMANYARMAINLDRYRRFPGNLPVSYVLVNIPSFTLAAVYNDSIAMRSKVIVGKPRTRSPLLNSKFNTIIFYPQWNVPESIVYNEIIPGMRRNPQYLEKKNMILLDANDSIIDPTNIDWVNASAKNFRFRVRQGEGLDNSLGIIKFNFPNPYSVYLHDTNARSLFRLDERSLSHGCVRVENWDDLAHFLSSPSAMPNNDTSLVKFIRAGKRESIGLKTGTSLFIRYFTYFDTGEGLKQYADVYGEDNKLIYKYL